MIFRRQIKWEGIDTWGLEMWGIFQVSNFANWVEDVILKTKEDDKVSSVFDTSFQGSLEPPGGGI